MPVNSLRRVLQGMILHAAAMPVSPSDLAMTSASLFLLTQRKKLSVSPHVIGH